MASGWVSLAGFSVLCCFARRKENDLAPKIPLFPHLKSMKKASRGKKRQRLRVFCLPACVRGYFLAAKK